MEPESIAVKGARVHNLQDVSLTLPRNRLICLTGVSGSGKSSFAFDTLFAEGQRRYIESLSAYARQFLGQLAKPDVDLITGLSPAISIQQKRGSWNPRSTVGTITQIHDYLRVLFARAGRPHCPQCDRRITAQTREQIVSRILSMLPGTALLILAPVVRGQKGEFRDLFEDMLKRGYARARVDGRVVQLSEDPQLGRNIRHDIEIVMDRIVLKGNVGSRLAEAVESALHLGEGTLVVAPLDDVAATKTVRRGKKDRSGDLLLSSEYACTRCDVSFEPPSPQMFSFNSPTGMCLTCDGLGRCFDFDPALLVPDDRKSFLNLAIAPMRTRIGRWRRHIYQAVAREAEFDLRAPWRDLSAKAKKALLYGLGDKHLTYEWRWSGGVWRHGGTFDGVIAQLRGKYRKTRSRTLRAFYEKYMRHSVCSACDGARLNAQALSVRVGGKNIFEVCSLSIGEAAEFIDGLELTETEQRIAVDVLKEVRARLAFLQDVGLEYLDLDRSAPTLAGGEAQRIRLASQIGSGLVGVMYILDEPSIGLHARDNRRLLDSLLRLRDMGNTVIVVEHDEETMRAADHIIDFGPGPGVRGGQVVAEGTIDDVQRAKKSITGQYLKGSEEIEVPKQRRPVVRPGLANAKTSRTPRGRRQ
ncbi:MAG: excinuclease ABC subunit UvrA [Planctomycetes bacterium]|nr:excinuclease ABC subunit UvrA [Planctomycetota bacterium]